jgi:F-type H+-transporting ATPase subunit alpha
MTDGQIMLNAALFGEGQKPALDLGLSVSRVGTKIQWPIIKNLAAPLRLEYLQLRQLQKQSKLRAGNQSEEVVQKLWRGEIMTQLLRQGKNSPVLLEGLVLIFYAFKQGYLTPLTMPQIMDFQDNILEFAINNYPEFMKELRVKKKMNDDIEKNLNIVIKAFIDQLKAEEEPKVDKTPVSENITENLGEQVLNEANKAA